jgi:uncharacterized protein (TIGR03435 family)
MKRGQNKAGKILNRFLAEFGNPPRNSMETSRERLRKTLNSDITVASDLPLFEMEEGRSRRPIRSWAAIAAVASLVVVSSIALLEIPGTSDRTPASEAPEAPEAIVEAANEALLVTSPQGERPVHVDDRIGFGDTVRSLAGATIALADTTRVELRPQTEFALERAADGVRIRLIEGGLVIHAAKQTAGYLYVQTKDMTVFVVGTVFLVNAEAGGSRVAVIEGEVRVQQGTTTRNLLRGEQLSTNPKLELPSVKEEVAAWVRTLEIPAALLQQSTGTAAPRRLQFEVATLRPVEEGGRPTDLYCRGIDGAWAHSFRNEEANAAPVPLGRCSGALSLKQFVALATGFPQQRTSGIELGMFEDVYQLEGKAESPTTTTKEQIREMIASLVMDRFKLRTHIEIKEADGYSLSLAPGGPKFKQTQDNEELTKRPPACGTCFDGKFTLKRFANGLEFSPIFIGGPVVDKTGLKGVYTIKLDIERVVDAFAAGARGERGAGGPAEPPRREFDPPLPKALEQQLGLRLEAGKVQVEHLVVDHWERATNN